MPKPLEEETHLWEISNDLQERVQRHNNGLYDLFRAYSNAGVPIPDSVKDLVQRDYDSICIDSVALRALYKRSIVPEDWDVVESFIPTPLNLEVFDERVS